MLIKVVKQSIWCIFVGAMDHSIRFIWANIWQRNNSIAESTIYCKKYVFNGLVKNSSRLKNVLTSLQKLSRHDDVMKWKHFPRYWPFVRGIYRSPLNSPHKSQLGCFLWSAPETMIIPMIPMMVLVAGLLAPMTRSRIDLGTSHLVYLVTSLFFILSFSSVCLSL